MINDAGRLLDAYLQRLPGESARAAPLRAFIESTADAADLTSRKNPVGHITGSAFIVDTSRAVLLMVHHRALGRWLQPGGHVDAGESALEAAMREAVEETGVAAAELSLVQLIAGSPNVPMDVDSHAIPANPKKNEGPHVHHDLRYLFVYSGDGLLLHNEQESHGVRWVPFDEVTRVEEFRGVIAKIVEMIK
jgi:8-oxo-dGTP pyrophosphatase MutT (NUDIX family)